MALTAAITAASSLIGGIAGKQQADYKAAVARNNAIIAERNAQVTSEAASQDAMYSDIQLADLLGTQSAIQGASGLSGRTMNLVRKSTRETGRIDALNIVKSGETEGRNFLQQAADFKGEAKMAKREGKFALVSGLLGAAGSLAGDAMATRSPIGNWFTKAKVNSIKAVRRI